mgnify:CR=1 FL=1
MATNVQNAAKGQRKAMELLYEANKKKVYYVSLCLSGEAAYAIDATYQSFKNVWSSISAHGITTEDEFTHLAVRKAVEWCKRRVSKSNARAFRIPHNRNFLISGDSIVSENSKNIAMEVLGKLPDLQRFIFVMHTVGDYLPEQIASSFKFDMKTVSIAYACGFSDYNYFLRIFKKEYGKSPKALKKQK